MKTRKVGGETTINEFDGKFAYCEIYETYGSESNRKSTTIGFVNNFVS